MSDKLDLAAIRQRDKEEYKDLPTAQDYMRVPIGQVVRDRHALLAEVEHLQGQVAVLRAALENLHRSITNWVDPWVCHAYVGKELEVSKRAWVDTQAAAEAYRREVEAPLAARITVLEEALQHFVLDKESKKRFKRESGWPAFTMASCLGAEIALGKSFDEIMAAEERKGRDQEAHDQQVRREALEEAATMLDRLLADSSHRWTLAEGAAKVRALAQTDTSTWPWRHSESEADDAART